MARLQLLWLRRGNGPNRRNQRTRLRRCSFFMFTGNTERSQTFEQAPALRVSRGWRICTLRIDLALCGHRQIFNTRHAGRTKRLLRDRRHIMRRSSLNGRSRGLLNLRHIKRLLPGLYWLQHHFVDDLRGGLQQLSHSCGRMGMCLHRGRRCILRILLMILLRRRLGSSINRLRFSLNRGLLNGNRLDCARFDFHRASGSSCLSAKFLSCFGDARLGRLEFARISGPVDTGRYD